MKTPYLSKSKVMLLVLIAVFTLIAAMMVLPYMKTIIAAVTAGFIFLPLYRLTKRLVRFDWLASIIVIFVIFFFLIVPLAISGILLAQELAILADMSTTHVEEIVHGLSALSMPEYLDGIISIEELQDYINTALSNLAFRSTQWIERLLANSLNFLLALLIFTFVTFYFFKDYDKLRAKVDSITESLFDNEDYRKIKKYLARVATTLNAVIRGTIIMTLIQAALLIPLFYALGLETPILWAILTFFVAMLPMIGTIVIWGPLTVIAFIKGFMTGDPTLMIIAVIGVIWGLFVSNVDNFLRPALIGRQGKIHPLMILIGILGGIKVFGVAGIFVGPVILTAAFLFIETFLIENNNIEEDA
jgi:predicted PurR-regulated permease PerM